MAPFVISQVKSEDADFGWGVVVNFCKKSNVKVRQCHMCLSPLTHGCD